MISKGQGIIENRNHKHVETPGQEELRRIHQLQPPPPSTNQHRIRVGLVPAGGSIVDESFERTYPKA